MAVSPGGEKYTEFALFDSGSKSFTVTAANDVSFHFLATCSDYKLLEKLNRMTLTKYADMSAKTRELTDNLDAINEKCRYISFVILFQDLLF